MALPAIAAESLITMTSQGEKLELMKEDFIKAKSDNDIVTNNPIVYVNLSKSGSKKLNQFTIIHAKKAVEVKACEKDITWPYINEPIFSGSIILNGFITDKAAMKLADKLNSGKCN